MGKATCPVSCARAGHGEIPDDLLSNKSSSNTERIYLSGSWGPPHHRYLLPARHTPGRHPPGPQMEVAHRSYNAGCSEKSVFLVPRLSSSRPQRQWRLQGVARDRLHRPLTRHPLPRIRRLRGGPGVNQPWRSAHERLFRSSLTRPLRGPSASSYESPSREKRLYSVSFPTKTVNCFRL